jgi:hypothetical protein
MSEESQTFKLTEIADTRDKAERWLLWASHHIETALDQEALVYLRSRGHDCHDQVNALIESWKTAEQARLDEYNHDIEVRDLRSGTKRSKEREPKVNGTNFAEISPISLRDFWDSAWLGDYSLDASMLRTVDWCGIAGFEPWWRRLAQSRKEKQLQGGLEESAAAAYWLFNMVRSDFAIKLMPGVLDGYLQYIGFVGLDKHLPWVFDGPLRRIGTDASKVTHDTRMGNRGPACQEQHLAYASALVFAHHRLPSDNGALELVHRAVETICKHQDRNGAWRSLTEDADVSIESTAMALHALALAQPPGWPRTAAAARDWLWSMQKDDGSWNEPGAAGPVHLTVLVLDAIALANGDKTLTFRRRVTPQTTPRQDVLGQPAVEPGPYPENLSSGLNPPEASGGAVDIPEDGHSETASQPGSANLKGHASTLTVAQRRRAAIDAYIEEVFLKTKRRITRTDIWTAAKYKDATEFERWQRDDPKTTKAAVKAFSRILTSKLHLK